MREKAMAGRLAGSAGLGRWQAARCCPRRRCGVMARNMSATGRQARLPLFFFFFFFVRHIGHETLEGGFERCAMGTFVGDIDDTE